MFVSSYAEDLALWFGCIVHSTEYTTAVTVLENEISLFVDSTH